MASSDEIVISVAARSSALSRAQVAEVLGEIRQHDPRITFSPIWVTTTGDKDLISSLIEKEKTDFFTREIDQMLLYKECQIAIHSAKDLPEPLPKGLCCIALTKGVDSKDVLVLRRGESISSLTSFSKVATSSLRRQQMIQELGTHFCTVEIRGTIEQRLKKLDEGTVDAVVMAEAALIRLGLTERNRVPLPGPTATYQGQLAIIARTDDEAMARLFSLIDVRSMQKAVT